VSAPNAELAYRVLDHIDAYPKQWHQGIWIGPANCGTVGCFAGWACLLSGDQPALDPDDEGEAEEVWVEGGATLRYIPDRAAALLGIRPDAGPTSGAGYRLFGGKNTREDLGRLVAEIFGPRPAVTA
jgi:hypothetical protein